jgi:hypothetical protein
MNPVLHLKDKTINANELAGMIQVAYIKVKTFKCEHFRYEFRNVCIHSLAFWYVGNTHL